MKTNWIGKNFIVRVGIWLVLILAACGDLREIGDASVVEITDSGDFCALSKSRCLENIVQHCQSGNWVNWTNCDEFDTQCVLIEGEAICMTILEDDSDSN